MASRQLAVVTGLVFVLVAGGRGVEAQVAKAIPQIGLLSPFTPSNPWIGVDGVRPAPSNLGYIDGENIRVEFRWSVGHDDRFPALAAELVALKVAVLVAATVPAIVAAQRIPTTIQIVMILSSDPMRLGLVRSLARPGGNTTGLAPLTFDLAPTRLELLKEVVLKLHEVAVLVNPANPAVRDGVSQTEVAVKALGLRTRTLEVHGAGELEAAFAPMRRERVDGPIVVPDPLHDRPGLPPRGPCGGQPAAGNVRAPGVRGGGRARAYGLNVAEHVREGLRWVDGFLKSARPRDLPVEQPTRFELVINATAAKALGLTVPPTVLARANEIIP